MKLVGEALRYIADAYNEAIKVVHAEEAMVERARRTVAQDVETWDDLNRWATGFYDLHVRHALTTAQYNMRFRGDVARGREQEQKAAAAMWLCAWWWAIIEDVRSLCKYPNNGQYQPTRLPDRMENIREVRP